MIDFAFPAGQKPYEFDYEPTPSPTWQLAEQRLRNILEMPQVPYYVGQTSPEEERLNEAVLSFFSPQALSARESAEWRKMQHESTLEQKRAQRRDRYYSAIVNLDTHIGKMLADGKTPPPALIQQRNNMVEGFKAEFEDDPRTRVLYPIDEEGNVLIPGQEKKKGVLGSIGAAVKFLFKDLLENIPEREPGAAPEDMYEFANKMFPDEATLLLRKADEKLKELPKPVADAIINEVRKRDTENTPQSRLRALFELYAEPPPEVEEKKKKEVASKLQKRLSVPRWARGEKNE